MACWSLWKRSAGSPDMSLIEAVLGVSCLEIMFLRFDVLDTRTLDVYH